MFNIGSYLAAGFAVLLALDYVSQPAGATLAYADVSAKAAISSASFYTVDRAKKGDRLSNPTNQAFEPAVQPASVRPPAARGKVLVGCDPAFSNLSAHARLNYASRCLA